MRSSEYQAAAGGARAKALPADTRSEGAAGTPTHADAVSASSRWCRGSVAASPPPFVSTDCRDVAASRACEAGGARGVRQPIAGESHDHDGRVAAAGGWVIGRRGGRGRRCHEGRRDDREHDDQLAHAAPPQQSDSTGSSLLRASACRLRADCARAVRFAGGWAWRKGGASAL